MELEHSIASPEVTPVSMRHPALRDRAVVRLALLGGELLPLALLAGPLT